MDRARTEDAGGSGRVGGIESDRPAFAELHRADHPKARRSELRGRNRDLLHRGLAALGDVRLAHRPVACMDQYVVLRGPGRGADLKEKALVGLSENARLNSRVSIVIVGIARVDEVHHDRSDIAPRDAIRFDDDTVLARLTVFVSIDAFVLGAERRKVLEWRFAGREAWPARSVSKDLFRGVHVFLILGARVRARQGHEAQNHEGEGHPSSNLHGIVLSLRLSVK